MDCLGMFVCQAGLAFTILNWSPDHWIFLEVNFLWAPLVRSVRIVKNVVIISQVVVVSLDIQVKPLSTHWLITMVLDTLCTILLSCESSLIGTTQLYTGVIHWDQDLAGGIFTYQTTLQVTSILILIVAIPTPSPQGILYMVLGVNSMLEATNSRQQISKYSMKQPHKELYPELLTLCFSLLLFVCWWRYDLNVTQFELLRILRSSFPSSLLPIIPRALIRPLRWGPSLLLSR